MEDPVKILTSIKVKFSISSNQFSFHEDAKEIFINIVFADEPGQGEARGGFITRWDRYLNLHIIPL